MTGPHVDQAGRDHLDDLGIVVDEDHTEDLRPTKMPPAGAPTPAEGLQNTHHRIGERKS